MVNIYSQRGSSTTGLLTASAIYVGLLAYAHFYAFNGQDDNSLAQQEDSLGQQDQMMTEKPSIDIIAPLAKGIFQSETIQTQAESSNVADDKGITKPSNKDDAGRVNQAKVDPMTVSTEAIQPELVTPANTPTYHSQAGFPAYQDYPVSSVYHGDNEQMNFDAQQRLASDIYYQNYLASYQRGHGDGRGRGQMDGDGEFDFSMNFKSRARMDADTDWDGDFVTQGAGSHYGNYGYDAIAHPYYQTYYYSRY